ncbi:hypothetical protein M422DRAFT_259229 [Sphaerobolus stellatus SS14]|uniref:Uncharacterized protein n=1 Tax=Sphaerobolus stellatus (strain SS14) TaxID=990650 RepID=A0A0C9VKQ0_SPHS4|nr:hypothetical protein M422DRAFT_259229 [Sphaerobolus stellatus SS14]
MPPIRTGSEVKPRVKRIFPPITNRLSLSPERSPSPPLLTLNQQITVPTAISESTSAWRGRRGGGNSARGSRSNNNGRASTPMIGDSPDPDIIPENRRVPKPRGEVGHPGSNGYSLLSVLSWDKTVYTTIQKAVHEQADAHLNTTVGISKQPDDLVLRVLQKVAHRFLILGKYDGYWPARDMLKLYLKNKSERAWRG